MDIAVETDVAALLRQWEEDHNSASYDPVPLLTRLCELVEAETENYLKVDPDPFDERHPSRADPNCAFGQLLKLLFRKDTFMNKLVNDYLRENYWSRFGVKRDIRALNTVACRLMIDILPGLETSVVFDSPASDALVQRLYQWAEKGGDPLQTYATGLIAAAMEVQDIANMNRESNNKLVPLMMDRLFHLHMTASLDKFGEGSSGASANFSRPFAHLAKERKEHAGSSLVLDNTLIHRNDPIAANNGLASSNAFESPVPEHVNGYIQDVDMAEQSDSLKRRRSADCNGMTSPIFNKKQSPYHSDFSNSSWVEMETLIISSVQIYPPTLATKQMFILKYLTLMGEYQEFLSHIIEKNALHLVLQLIDRKNWQNSRLTFEALRYLAAILCHKKFAIEFINMQGLQPPVTKKYLMVNTLPRAYKFEGCFEEVQVQRLNRKRIFMDFNIDKLSQVHDSTYYYLKLLDVPRIGISATGASICFFYLAHCEDAMEKLCSLPKHVLSHVIPKLIAYNLWLLECSHDSGRCHATMFFGLSFHFQVILNEFDEADGLRKMFNVLSTLPILASEEISRNEDEECSVRQIVRHVCAALKRYFEAHLFKKVETTSRRVMLDSGPSDTPGQNFLMSNYYKAGKSTPEIVREEITFLQNMKFTSRWPPVYKFMELGGITLMLKIIAFTYEWNYSGRAETVRSALDVINICSVLSMVQLKLCEPVDLPDDNNTIGITIILGAAEGEIVTDAEVQKSALNVIITCACAPITRDIANVSLFSSGSAKKKWTKVQSREDIIQKVWDCIRTSNGLMVLMTLMTIKTPITDADAIRALACQALAGLARSETVRQIISKLSLFSGQLQSLMNDPILQDKRQEHVMFQKYAVELMEKVSGKSKATGSQLEVSLANMHKANVVAQTRIQYNEQQLFQIIHQHLVKHGLKDTADLLQREANLPQVRPSLSSNMLSPFAYNLNKGRLTNAVESKHMKPVPQEQNNADTMSSLDTSKLSTQSCCSTPITPIRVNLNNRKFESKSFQFTSPSRSLQKPVRCEPMMPAQPGSHVTLDSIVTEYLANQHSLCKNPMVTCPQFDILAPHKCPDPRPKKLLYGNFATRHSKGIHLRRLDEHLVHSRFCVVKTFRFNEDDGYYTCCEFVNDKLLLAGTYKGNVKLLNVHTGVEEGTASCHSTYILNLATNTEGSLVATSSAWRSPLSALWKIQENSLENVRFFDDEEFFEFSHTSEDKLIGTRGAEANIYDIISGAKLLTLTPSQSNQYNKNRATFNPTDELVLSDGVLWDVKSGKEIHKFDKLNQTLSGVFHPNGLEIVSNAEVWDIRTFHLLRTVPSLDQCAVVFPRTGRTMYAVTIEREIEGDNTYDTSFKTLDAYDYSNITTVDVKKYICHLGCNKFDTQIALVENSGKNEEMEDTAIRIYDVGRSKDDDDEAEEDDDDDEEDEDVNSDDNSDSDDQGDEVPIGFVDNDDEDEEEDDNGDENEDEDDEDDDPFAVEMFDEMMELMQNGSGDESEDDDDEDIDVYYNF